MLQLEDKLKKKNLIFRGIPNEPDTNDAVRKVITSNLKISAPISIKSTKKLFDRHNEMSVIVQVEN